MFSPFSLMYWYFPLPLVTGYQDIQFRIVIIVDLEQRGGGRHGHTDQDKKGDDGPGNLNLGALMKAAANDGTF